MIRIVSGLVNNRSVLLWLVMLLQSALVFSTYRKIILHPHDYLFANYFDGIRNYYAYQYYIDQPWQRNPFLFLGLNYPFGDSIIYTDNMPLIAVAVKLLSAVFPGVATHALPIYNYLMLLGLLLSTYLLLRILGLLLHHKLLIGAMALLLPWSNPQIYRLQIGHMNLSLSVVLLAGLYFMLRMFLDYYQKRPVIRWQLSFIVLVVLASFLHMYYLALVLAFAGFFFLFWFLQSWRNKEPLLPIVRSGFLMVAVPAVVTFAITRAIDTYSHLRSTRANGYDLMDWKLNISALFTPYEHNTLRFFFEPAKMPHYESFAYLGAFFLFGVLALLLLHYFGKKQVYTSMPLPADLPDRFLQLLVLSAIANFFISLGDYYYIFNGEYKFTNYLNVFFYLGRITELTTQFRCLGRFSWIFFWTCQLVFLVVLDRTLLQKHRLWIQALVVALLCLAFIDLKDHLRYQRHSQKENNLTSAENTREMRQLAQVINPADYQAILTIPYFHVGTEGDFDYTIDPDEPLSNASMQLSLITGLPQMASKLGRTPPDFGAYQFFLFTSPVPELLNRLNERPVLVLYNKSYYDGRNNFYNNVAREPAREVIRKGADLPQRYNMQKLAEQNDWMLYRWYPKEKAAAFLHL